MLNPPKIIDSINMDSIKLLVLVYKVKETPIDFGNNFIQTLIENGALCLDYKELYNNYGFSDAKNYIIKYVKDNAINSIIFGISGWDFDFDVCFFEEIRKKSFLVMQIGDTEHYFEVHNRYYAQAMDFVIVDGNYITSFKFQEIGINSISYVGYFNTSQYHKIEGLQKDIDVSFIGQISYKIGRKEYIDYLVNNGIKLKTFGYDSLKGLLELDDKIKTINRSKININFSGISKTTRLTRKYKIHMRKKQFKGRICETAICGGFVLSEYFPGLEYLFEIGKEIVIFYDKEELLEKVKYYLTHEEERENIARKGYERAIRDYDAKLAVPKLIATIDGLRKKKIYKPSEIYLDEEFVRNYTSYRVLWILRFLKVRKWKFIFEELKIILKYRKLDWYQIRIFFIEEILDNLPKIKSVLKSIFKRKTE